MTYFTDQHCYSSSWISYLHCVTCWEEEYRVILMMEEAFQPEDSQRWPSLDLERSCFCHQLYARYLKLYYELERASLVSFIFPHIKSTLLCMHFSTPPIHFQAICIAANHSRRVLRASYHLSLLIVDLINLYAFADLSQMTLLWTCLLYFLSDWRKISQSLLCFNNICKEYTKNEISTWWRLRIRV